MYSLHFLSDIGKWILTNFIVDIESKKSYIEFTNLDKDGMLLSNQHMIYLKESQWLNKYMPICGYWEINTEKRTMYLSRKMAGFLKLSDESMFISLHDFLAMIHSDDLEKVIDAIDNVGTKQSLISRMLLKDGDIIYFDNYFVLVHDENGDPKKIIGYSYNITNQQETIDKLAIKEQHFRSIVENSSDLFLTLDTDGNITYVSPNISKLTGFQLDEVIGNKINNFILKSEERFCFLTEFQKILNHEPFNKGNYHFKTHKGKPLWLNLRASSIKGQNNQIISIVIICQDLSDEEDHISELKYIGTHDSLTGVYNRTSFVQELERLDNQNSKNFGLVLTDINGLKLINDTFGHKQGDLLLITVANLLKNIGEVYRIGGDEFAILYYKSHESDMKYIGEFINKECLQTKNNTIPLSIAYGYAHSDENIIDTQTMFRIAEGRMYNNKLMESRSMRSQIISSLKEAMRVRNLETSEHLARLEEMAKVIGKKTGLTNNDLDKLVMLASMHDIGKVAIPDNIINKPGRLTESEMEIMKSHCEVGKQIALTSKELSQVANEIFSHHERWDGKGYPSGKKGKEIPLLSRIISVVDTYDVMTHARVYKQAATHNQAIEEIKRCSGTQFDPLIVELFLQTFGKMNEEEIDNFVSAPKNKMIQLAYTT